ncbi:MAG: tetratricopeptide repeat protein [Burkholderiales bacterium]
MNNARHLVVLIATLLNCAVLSDAARAQDVARDYYAAGSDRTATAALRNLDRNHYQPAVKQLQDRHYRSALANLDFMLKYFPNHPQALAKVAEFGLATQRTDIAEQRFKDALARYPGDDETYVIYGTFLQKLGRVDAAIREYNKAIEIDPESVYAHYNLGLSYVDRKEYQQANIHAQKAYRLGAGFPGLRMKLQAVGAWNQEAGTSSDSTSPSASSPPKGPGKPN